MSRIAHSTDCRERYIVPRRKGRCYVRLHIHGRSTSLTPQGALCYWSQRWRINSNEIG